MRFRSGGIERESVRVRVKRVAMSMFAIRRAPNRDMCLILEGLRCIFWVRFMNIDRLIDIR